MRRFAVVLFWLNIIVALLSVYLKDWRDAFFYTVVSVVIMVILLATRGSSDDSETR